MASSSDDELVAPDDDGGGGVKRLAKKGAPPWRRGGLCMRVCRGVCFLARMHRADEFQRGVRDRSAMSLRRRAGSGAKGPGFGGVYLGPATDLIAGAPTARGGSLKQQPKERRLSSRSSSERRRADKAAEAAPAVWGGVYVGPAGDICTAAAAAAASHKRSAMDGVDEAGGASMLRRLSRSNKGPKAGKTRCEVCKKKCAGDILRADDKFFHISCFSCKTCHRPLSEVGFFARDGHYYCPNDFHAAFGVKCPVCQQFVEGSVVECMGDTYHQRCFRCSRCKQPFPHGEKVTYTGRDHLCHKCLNIPVATVKPTQLQEGGQLERVESPPQLASPTACAACEQPIHSGQVLLALDAQWHIWCFKCATCDSVLHGEYMARDGVPFCVRDYNAQFGVRCYECDKFIAGKVLQAGNYQFHSTCARCSRCGDPFGDGEEMYMQGDEIWHPRCSDVKPPEQIVHGVTRSPRSSFSPKYSCDFGKHLTYMYLLPEPALGYLKHPIEPHPMPPQQFHTPQGPVKIRKSRISMLKTGMQKLTEALDDENPRPKSPHMDNEEPIEMAHYPSGHAPAADDVPAIERDDFPAPPYPYAVEELKRRLSSSSLEDAADDDEQAMDEADAAEDAKLHRAEEELKKYEKDSSIVHVLVQNLEETQKKTRLPLHWDPRSASRSASGKKMPHLRCRYETPINASPSRYLNRPKPWVYWQQDRSATTAIPYSHIQPPKPGYSFAPKAATLPANGYFEEAARQFDELDATFCSSQMSERSLVSGAGTLPPRGAADQRFGDAPAALVGAGGLRKSLPDMSKPPVIYGYDDLLIENKKLPEEVDRCHLERHLARDEFEPLFGMTPIEFYKLPEWKRINLKRKAKLF